METRKITTDVLVIGGGVAGLMAAIKSEEQGKETIVVDKSNPRRSGNASTGNDHFLCYIPEIHGKINNILEEAMQSILGSLQEKELVKKCLQQSLNRVKDWERWDIPMKFDGEEYEFAGHAFPDHPRIFLKFKGKNLKPTLTKKALTEGATIESRCMMTDLLVQEGKVIGALGVNTREKRMTIFQAGNVILTTGMPTRLYPPITPEQSFNRSHAPHNTGDGIGMAYRGGAELVNMEIPYRHAGPKLFARCGKATWIGLLKDSEGEILNPFLETPSKKYGDISPDVWPNLFEEKKKKGNSPVYIDCRDISKEDKEYMKKGLEHEGNTALLEYMEREEIDFQSDKIIFTNYEICPYGGIKINKKAEASLDGLYAAGDTVGNFWGGIGGAAVYGWIAGKNADNSVKKSQICSDDLSVIEERKKVCRKILSRNYGAKWKETSAALQQIMQDYAGKTRSQNSLSAGLKNLRRLRNKSLNELTAENPHELMRCLEVLNLIDVGELVFLTAMKRKETRKPHVSVDYKYTNPKMNRFLIVKQVKGEPIIEWGKKFP
ncbi:hypothetical protein AKJ38_03890 [candidate division MSBL1 archaeon SCGC-AAA259I14]|uniref:FAD-dependent oxidoreductase 2 FAD binding domain-containing protein n=1 Tax=candidate division MSBL1 archaeon SCGC-AAA259I14 TaxID=1698268 RepID=A0A133UPR4_9EURY|nr:hypothetical protein AKJ38_03890 [candidate division MSBL1 archaeon SCGC-AAA259I14]